MMSALGEHVVTMRGVEIKQPVKHYSLWMFQRVLDHYQSLANVEREAVNTVLDSTGILPYLELQPARRMERVNNIEVFV